MRIHRRRDESVWRATVSEAPSLLAHPPTGDDRIRHRPHTSSVITDLETWRPSQPRIERPPAAAAPAFREDEDLPSPAPAFPVAPSTADDRIALLERLEREALATRFRELDRRSEELAAEQQRVFAERLDAAIAAELEQLRERRQAAVAELDAWAASGRERVTNELAAEEQRFAERLMRQLTEFEAQLGARLREQEQKLAGWWSEAERLADERMRAALREVDAA